VDRWRAGGRHHVWALTHNGLREHVGYANLPLTSIRDEVTHMDSRTRRAASFLWTAVFIVVLCLVGAVAAYTVRPAMSYGMATTGAPQDVIRLESRLSQLEQRFYSLEMNMRSLEQQSRQAVPARESSARETELFLLRAEVEALQQRLAEIECGLARVDERTLNPSAREARRKTKAGAVDPCRLNADAPLLLLTRP